MNSSNQTAISVITSTIALMSFLCVFSVCYLSYRGIQIPPELNTLTGGLCGALTAMLVKTSPTETLKTPNPDLPSPVTVVNAPSDPVPTEEQKIDKPFGL